MDYTKKILLTLLVLLSLSTISYAESVARSESDAARILLLEKALAPDTAEKVASLFAKANKERNGAIQFMLFSDNLRNKFKDAWPNWVSGTSSPWITSYTIKRTATAKNKFDFVITYQWATAEGPFKPSLEQKISIELVPKNIDSSQKWWISQFDDNQG